MMMAQQQQPPRPMRRLPLDAEIDALLDRLEPRAAAELQQDPPAEILSGTTDTQQRRMFGLARAYFRLKDELDQINSERAVVLTEYAQAQAALQTRIERAALMLEVMAPKHVPRGKKSVAFPGLARLQFKQAGGTWVIEDDATVIEKLPADVKPELVETVEKLKRQEFRAWADTEYEAGHFAHVDEEGVRHEDLPVPRVPEYDSFSIVDLRKEREEPDEPPPSDDDEPELMPIAGGGEADVSTGEIYEHAPAGAGDIALTD